MLIVIVKDREYHFRRQCFKRPEAFIPDNYSSEREDGEEGGEEEEKRMRGTGGIIVVSWLSMLYVGMRQLQVNQCY